MDCAVLLQEKEKESLESLWNDGQISAPLTRALPMHFGPVRPGQRSLVLGSDASAQLSHGGKGNGALGLAVGFRLAAAHSQ